MQSPRPAIEMAGLSKQFGRHRAVDSLTLAVRSGTVFGFLGPNGAGKTTTIRMLLGLIRPSHGSGRILGHDIERERAAILPHVGAIVECLFEENRGAAPAPAVKLPIPTKAPALGLVGRFMNFILKA